ncbi:ester cyclase [Prauserella flavalba]|nr:ester cyclase [Prauserella flavalba]
MMTPEERRETLRRVVDDLWNRGNLDACDELFAEHCSFHDPSFPVDGVEGMKRQVADLRQAQPDLHMDVQDVLVDGDLTCARWTMGATARNEFRGLPATGKSYVMTGMTIDKWEGDRIVEEWVNYDLFGALQQAGIIPEAATPPAATE